MKMDKEQFLSSVRDGWESWQKLLEQVEPNGMTRPGLGGTWSLKDVIAHITWCEKEMIGVLRERALHGSPLWQLDQTARNQIIYEENLPRSLDDVLAESQAVHTRLIEELETLPEEHLGNPARFADMPADWLPWQVIADNTYDHYRDHERDLGKWLASGAG